MKRLKTLLLLCLAYGASAQETASNNAISVWKDGSNLVVKNNLKMNLQWYYCPATIKVFTVCAEKSFWETKILDNVWRYAEEYSFHLPGTYIVKVQLMRAGCNAINKDYSEITLTVNNE